VTLALSAREVLDLPAAVDIVTAGKALGGIGRTKAHELARSGQFPVEVLRIGASYRVRRSDLIKYLGIEPEGVTYGRGMAERPACADGSLQ
jgi:hypothetical protein